MLKDNDGVKTNVQADVVVGYWQLDRRKRRSNNLSSQCMNSNDGPWKKLIKQRAERDCENSLMYIAGDTLISEDWINTVSKTTLG